MLTGQDPIFGGILTDGKISRLGCFGNVTRRRPSDKKMLPAGNQLILMRFDPLFIVFGHSWKLIEYTRVATLILRSICWDTARVVACGDWRLFGF